MALNQPSEGFLCALREAAGPDGWADPETEPEYLREPRDRLQGRAAIVVKPRTVEAAARIVTLCGAARVGVVPYAGGTGLVGGQVATAPPDPVVLSVERMRRVRGFDAEDDAMTVEAGCTLAEARALAAENDRQFPLFIASEGECRIGGNLATNAGGMHVIRYGNARDLCLGVEAVLADGRVWDGLSPLRKDNTGYDLRDLLIGSEGTLGIITAATLRLYPRPRDEATAFGAVPDPAAATALALELRAEIGDILSAAELMERTGIEFVSEHFPVLRNPLAGEHRWYVMIEAEGGAGSGARARLEAALGRAFEAGLLVDAVLAESVAQRDAIRSLREAIPVANRAVGAIATHDVSVPLGRIPALAEAVRSIAARRDRRIRTNIFGHLGDGNLHANLFPPAGISRDEYAEMTPLVMDDVFAAVRALGGSVSAEHGVGRARKREAVDQGSTVRRDAMRAIKRALDPLGILNPGAVVDLEEDAA